MFNVVSKIFQNKFSKTILFIVFMLVSLQGNIFAANSQTVFEINQGNTNGGLNTTEVVRNIIESSKTGNFKIKFSKGIYHFYSDKAWHEYRCITNHDNGIKRIIFKLKDLHNVEIDGQGADFIFHGLALPFLLDNSTNIKLRNFSVDWDKPFYIQGEVVETNPNENKFDLQMFNERFSYQIVDSKICFPIVQNIPVFQSLGEGLAFDKLRKTPVSNGDLYDYHGHLYEKVSLLSNGNIQIKGGFKNLPPLHSVVVFKGEMGENRYAPAFHAFHSKNISATNIKVYHAPGMGFLAEKSENINLYKFDVCLRDGSNRYVSTIADATHFASCSGKILLDSCLFENMLDDGTNVHGTYMEIDSIPDNHTLLADLKHFQQAGFEFAKKHDQIWILSAPNSSRSNLNTVSKMEQLSDTKCKLTVRLPLSENIKKGDLLENKSDYPKLFVVRNCVFRNHRARNIVLKTPGKVLIQNNNFQSMMASILIRAEAYQWYESGAVKNVVIKNNTFENCVSGGGNQAILHISPKFNKRFSCNDLFDKHIYFINNKINMFNFKVIDAERVKNLSVIGNIIIEKSDFEALVGNEKQIKLQQCKNVKIKDNIVNYVDNILLEIDQISKKSLKTDSKTTIQLEDGKQ